MTDYAMVLTTCATRDEAERIALALVDARLAACVQIGASVTSIYRWRGALERAEEHTLTIKTRNDLLSSLAAELRRLHSYDVPQIVSVPFIYGASDYFAWMDGELAPRAR